MRKIIFRVIAALVLLLVILLGIGWAFVDTLAKKGIEKGATYALGVDTTVSDVDLSLLHGSLELEGLNIANPPNFTTSHLMNMGKLETSLVTSSLMGDTVEVTKFEIDSLDVNIEKEAGLNMQTNVSKIMDNLQKLSSGEAKKDEEGAGGKKVKIDRVLITNVVAHFSLGSGLPDAKVEIPEILLTDVTSDNAGGMVISELAPRLITAILQAVLEQAEGKVSPLAAGIMSTLNKEVAGASKSFGGSIKITTEK